MGYTTKFDGEVTVTPPLNPHEIAYLEKFADTRRMDRMKGPYFVDGTGFFGQGEDPDIRDYNRPPRGQPNLWCHWVPTPEGDAIEWDQCEKFYDAAEWMSYLIDHFLKPGAHAQVDPGPNPPAEFAHFTFNHCVDGWIDAQGEDPDDRWRLVVEDNRVSTQSADITYH
ncbi:hypothetical protein [Nocardiopsis rhodophaea]|uniref:hypothetical protein n=1 Tax=Nocardiopsis rhodophaea TaxID=280238 RepID=UPI0031D20059